MSKKKSDFDEVKEHLPQFIIKLHDMLEEEFSPFICWSDDGTEVLIKNQKKMEEKVLSNYFRHHKMSSFIRQMNMYGFMKVTKFLKEKNKISFKNEYFCQNDLTKMKYIKRNKNKHQDDPKSFEDSQECKSQKKLQSTQDFSEEKRKIFLAFEEISLFLQKTTQINPFISLQIAPALRICEEMKQRQHFLEKPENPQIQPNNFKSFNSISQFLNDNDPQPKQQIFNNAFSLSSLGSFGKL